MFLPRIGRICSPFAEQKSASAAARESPILFQRSVNIAGSKHEGPERSFCCWMTDKDNLISCSKLLNLWNRLLRLWLTLLSVCWSKERSPSQSPHPERSETWGCRGSREKLWPNIQTGKHRSGGCVPDRSPTAEILAARSGCPPQLWHPHLVWQTEPRWKQPEAKGEVRKGPQSQELKTKITWL